MIKGGMKQIIRGMFDSEQVGDAAANRARIAKMQKEEAAAKAAEKAEKEAKKAAEGKTARQADPHINPKRINKNKT